ncbi:MAG: DUF3618 domain-containing protein [Longimicrobiaceae bacterium]
MADYRNEDDTLPGGLKGMNSTRETDPEHLIPDHTSAPAVPGTVAGGVTGDPDAVRDEIERTRARMSSTIEQIEGALQRKKGEIQEKLDVVAPVRERPWLFAAGVFGTGLALGLLTGGGDDDDHDHVKVPRALLAGMGLEENGGLAGNGGTGRGADLDELMQVVARQEEEIRDLRAALYGDDLGPEGDGFTGETNLAGADALGDVEVENEWDEEWNFDDGDDALDDFGAFGVEGERRGFLGKAVTAAVAAGLAGALGGLGKKLVANRGRGGEMDVEVDLERGGGAAVDERVDQEWLAARREGFAGRGEMDVEVELEGAYTGPEYGGRAQYGRELDLEGGQDRGGRRLPVSPLAGAVAAGAAALVGGLVAKLVSDRSHRGEMDVEVELEERHTSSPQPITAERTYEVELERPGGAPADPPMM